MVCGNALSCLRVLVVYIWVLERDFMTLVFAYPKAVVCDLTQSWREEEARFEYTI